MSNDHFCFKAYVDHEDGQRRYPVKQKSKKTGNYTFRALPPGSNLEADNIHYENEADLLKDIKAGKPYRVRMRSFTGGQINAFLIEHIKLVEGK